MSATRWLYTYRDAASEGFTQVDGRLGSPHAMRLSAEVMLGSWISKGTASAVLVNSRLLQRDKAVERKISSTS